MLLSYALPATSVVALVVVCLLVPCKPRRQGYGLVLLVIVEDDLVLLHKHWLVLAVPQVRHDLELDVRVREMKSDHARGAIQVTAHDIWKGCSDEHSMYFVYAPRQM